ncbi:NUDIX domain-containing protein [Kitasatospora sp. NPDC058048]|uniref:NUDIX domain-containing protein n=1 Tax=Kitasatospora sp. NPDC058048 TaxID=3346313 RepID=UPI0036DC3F5E
MESSRRTVAVIAPDRDRGQGRGRGRGRAATVRCTASGRGTTPMWTIPGGKVEVDERLDEAAARELRERTGLLRPRLGNERFDPRTLIGA